MPQSLSNENLARLSELIFAGRKIEAIKVYREMTGCGLKDAKEHVEDLEASLRQTAPDRFQAASGKGCMGASAAVFAFGLVSTIAWIATH
jgi:ribosomal protein L7/L12